MDFQTIVALLAISAPFRLQHQGNYSLHWKTQLVIVYIRINNLYPKIQIRDVIIKDHDIGYNFAIESLSIRPLVTEESVPKAMIKMHYTLCCLKAVQIAKCLTLLVESHLSALYCDMDMVKPKGREKLLFLNS